MTLFCIRGPDDKDRWNRKNCPKFFHRVIFAFWIQICNPNIYKSHELWNTTNIEKLRCFDDQNRWNMKNSLKFFHRVIFAFWMQFCNPKLCKSYTFWNTANTEKWPCFAYADLMTEINEIENNCPKFFHRVIFVFWIQICNPNLCTSDTFWNTANIETDLVLHTRNSWRKSMKSEKLPEIIS